MAGFFITYILLLSSITLNFLLGTSGDCNLRVLNLRLV